MDSKKDAESLCICKKCSSYIECGEKLAFCHPKLGKSKCIKIEKGCICGACPVTKKYKLWKGYYCTRGADKDWKE